MERPSEQEIPHQHRSLVAEHRIGAGKPAAQQAFIHHIVMQQGGGVNELDAGSEHDMPRALIAAHPRAGQRQQRPQPLAAGRHQMGGKLRNERHLTFHPVNDGLVTGA